MKITVEQLKALDACTEGIEAFREFAGKEEVSIEWTLETQLKIMKNPQINKYIFWAFRHKIMPLFSMRGADLNGANLRWADLSGADLSRADLNGANLNGADLSDAALNRADLNRANLRDADLRDADLSDVDLSGANLK